MPVYIARRASTYGLLGIFAVADLEGLASYVQNFAEPDECKYCEIDTGGILWPATGGRKMPADASVPGAEIYEVEDQEDPDPLRLLSGAILTDSWQEAFYEDSHSWQLVPLIGEVDATGA